MGVGRTHRGYWDLPKGIGVVLEETGHAGDPHSLQAMLLKEGAQNEVPGEGSCLRHLFPGGKDIHKAD